MKSVDWQSLTMSGERHQLQLRVPGPRAQMIVEQMCAGLEEAEFSIPGIIVADIALASQLKHGLDGSIGLDIEALTISDD